MEGKSHKCSLVSTRCKYIKQLKQECMQAFYYNIMCFLILLISILGLRCLLPKTVLNIYLIARADLLVNFLTDFRRALICSRERLSFFLNTSS